MRIFTPFHGAMLSAKSFFANDLCVLLLFFVIHHAGCAAVWNGWRTPAKQTSGCFGVNFGEPDPNGIMTKQNIGSVIVLHVFQHILLHFNPFLSFALYLMKKDIVEGFTF